MIKAIKLITLICFILTTGSLYSQESNNLFDRNIFEGISSSPDYYRGKNFEIIENIPEEGGYADRANADIVVTVRNSEIDIDYWRINGEYRIQIVIISNNTDLSVWGKYIGEEVENVLEKFINPYRKNESEISYNSDNWQYFLTFKLSNGKVTEIVFGLNI